LVVRSRISKYKSTANENSTERSFFTFQIGRDT
jgi:hypothetical protein